MRQLPKARTTDLLEMEADGELLVYDLRINKAYNLSETSKIVYRCCNGRTTFDELEKKYKFSADLIHLALGELNTSDLLENYASDHFAGLTRREVIKKVGLASMIALPVISSLIAPNAANAASASGSCTTDICTPSGQNLCAGCAGRTVTIDAYIPGSGCTGRVVGSTSRACSADGTPLTSNADTRRTSVQ